VVSDRWAVPIDWQRGLGPRARRFVRELHIIARRIVVFHSARSLSGRGMGTGAAGQTSLKTPA